MTTVGIVIPAYRPNIDQLSEYINELKRETNADVIRIEADDSNDAELDRLRAQSVTIGTSNKRRGKGGAITAGFEAIDTDILGFVDADGSTPASYMDLIISSVKNRPADLAVGSRLHPESTVATQQSHVRQYMGKAFVLLARQLLEVKLYDYQCGAKALTAETWQSVREHIYEPGFAWDIELLAMAEACGFRIEEVPITWFDKPDSTVDPIRTSVAMFRTLLASRSRAKQIKGSRLHKTIGSAGEKQMSLIRKE